MIVQYEPATLISIESSNRKLELIRGTKSFIIVDNGDNSNTVYINEINALEEFNRKLEEIQ